MYIELTDILLKIITIGPLVQGVNDFPTSYYY